MKVHIKLINEVNYEDTVNRMFLAAFNVSENAWQNNLHVSKTPKTWYVAKTAGVTTIAVRDQFLRAIKTNADENN